MPVEMIGLEVEQDGDARAETVDVLELKARQLADDPRIRGERAVEARQRSAYVPGHRDRFAGCPEHRAEQLARGRLSVRAGDADEGVGEQAETELDFAPDRNAARARSLRQRRVSRHTRALDQQLDVVQQAVLLSPQVDFDARLGKPPGAEVL